MRLIVARCSVEYSGRLSARLPEALRLVMLKADGSVLVHADAGGYKPLNWMTPPTVVEEEDGVIVVRKLKGEDRLDITLHEVVSDVGPPMDEDAARLEKDGVERDLQELLADLPERCGEGFRLVRREWPTDIGPVDLMCRDDGRRLGRGRDQARRDDRRGRAALALPRADPAGPGAGRLRGRAGGADDQAAGARAGRGARAALGRGRPRGAARRARAGADAVRRMSADPVLAEARDGVLEITLNRPEARNAVNAAVAEGVAAALDRLDGDDELRVGILTGAGSSFCAGMDLKAFVAGERPYAEGRGFAGIAQRPPEKPIIAAIEGYAVAGGFEVALACDLIVAARDAKVGIPEVKRGLVAAAGALIRLPEADPVPPGDGAGADRRPDHAPSARTRSGSSTGSPSRAAALAAARELAAAIAANGPLAIAGSKQILSAAVDWTEAEAWERQGEISGPIFASEDAREGADGLRREAPAGLARPLKGLSLGLAVQRGEQAAGAAAVAVLAQVDALPGAEREPAVADRQRQRRAEQRRLDVGRHVVGALDGVRPVGRVLGHGRRRSRTRSRRGRRARRSR